jgi:hypothetical protein
MWMVILISTTLILLVLLMALQRVPVMESQSVPVIFSSIAKPLTQEWDHGDELLVQNRPLPINENGRHMLKSEKSIPQITQIFQAVEHIDLGVYDSMYWYVVNSKLHPKHFLTIPIRAYQKTTHSEAWITLGGACYGRGSHVGIAPLLTQEADTLQITRSGIVVSKEAIDTQLLQYIPFTGSARSIGRCLKGYTVLDNPTGSLVAYRVYGGVHVEGLQPYTPVQFFSAPPGKLIQLFIWENDVVVSTEHVLYHRNNQWQWHKQGHCYSRLWLFADGGLCRFIGDGNQVFFEEVFLDGRFEIHKVLTLEEASDIKDINIADDKLLIVSRAGNTRVRKVWSVPIYEYTTINVNKKVNR